MPFLSTPSARRATIYIELDGSPKFISIHALREEGDTIAPALFCARTISIHALREEGDASEVLLSLRQLGISIHALREEGDSKNRDKISIFKQIIQHSARI